MNVFLPEGSEIVVGSRKKIGIALIIKFSSCVFSYKNFYLIVVLVIACLRNLLNLEFNYNSSHTATF